MPAMRIAIIDDNAHALQLAKLVLANLPGATTREYADAQAALTDMPMWRPDLILVDYEMRPMDGLEFTRRVRAGPREWCAVPVLMMTGHTSSEHVVAARKAGVDGFVAKPFSVEGLLSRMRKVLEAQATMARRKSALI